MRKTVLASAVVALALGGCQTKDDGNINPSPAPVPSVAESKTTKPAEPSKQPTKTVEPEPTTVKPEEPKPTTATTTEAGTPATQFAQRWGLRYPSVPEYAILKAANGTCLLIEQGGADWFSDPMIMGGIEEIITAFGIEKNQALEFAQDADQNYCSSVGNPT
jgi:hypothetical protein